MLAPPKPPSHADPDALIPQARDRQRRRQLLAATSIALGTGLALGIYALLGGSSSSSKRQSAPKPTAVPMCRSSQLSDGPIAFIGQVPNEDVGGLELKNVSSASCSLLGTPRVIVYAGGARLPVQQLPANGSVPNSRGAHPHHVLAPGEHAYVVFNWRNWCGRGRYAHATLRYAFSGGPVLAEGSSLPACSARGSGSTIRVGGPFASH